MDVPHPLRRRVIPNMSPFTEFVCLHYVTPSVLGLLTGDGIVYEWFSFARLIKMRVCVICSFVSSPFFSDELLIFF